MFVQWTVGNITVSVTLKRIARVCLWFVYSTFIQNSGCGDNNFILVRIVFVERLVSVTEQVR